MQQGRSRPKTCDSKRPQTAAPVKTPRGAWNTPGARTPARPLSAGRIPHVDPHLILVDSELPPSDPAVPLVEAIKRELTKYQLIK